MTGLLARKALDKTGKIVRERAFHRQGCTVDGMGQVEAVRVEGLAADEVLPGVAVQRIADQGMS